MEVCWATGGGWTDATWEGGKGWVDDEEGHDAQHAAAFCDDGRGQRTDEEGLVHGSGCPFRQGAVLSPY
eukprot:3662537-Ditylum_brightwellii.AAC.1